MRRLPRKGAWVQYVTAHGPRWERESPDGKYIGIIQKHGWSWDWAWAQRVYPLTNRVPLAYGGTKTLAEAIRAADRWIGEEMSRHLNPSHAHFYRIGGPTIVELCREAARKAGITFRVAHRPDSQGGQQVYYVAGQPMTPGEAARHLGVTWPSRRNPYDERERMEDEVESEIRRLRSYLDRNAHRHSIRLSNDRRRLQALLNKRAALYDLRPKGAWCRYCGGPASDGSGDCGECRRTPTSHAAHAARVGVSTPCTAHHVNYGGGCLNCGWTPTSRQRSNPLTFRILRTRSEDPKKTYAMEWSAPGMPGVARLYFSSIKAAEEVAEAFREWHGHEVVVMDGRRKNPKGRTIYARVTQRDPAYLTLVKALTKADRSMSEDPTLEYVDIMGRQGRLRALVVRIHRDGHVTRR